MVWKPKPKLAAVHKRMPRSSSHLELRKMHLILGLCLHGYLRAWKHWAELTHIDTKSWRTWSQARTSGIRGTLLEKNMETSTPFLWYLLSNHVWERGINQRMWWTKQQHFSYQEHARTVSLYHSLLYLEQLASARQALSLLNLSQAWFSVTSTCSTCFLVSWLFESFDLFWPEVSKKRSVLKT